MSMLFETADTNANKRKSRLLENPMHARVIFSNHTKTPLIPTMQDRQPHSLHIPPLAESFENIDSNSHSIDFAWLLCVATLTLPIVYKLLQPAFYATSGGMPGLVYHCAFVYPSLFACLPGISVHLFCIFLLLYNRCKVGFFCYMIGIGMLVAAIEIHCTFGAVRWCAPLFAGSVAVNACGNIMLMRAIYGVSKCQTLWVVAWYTTIFLMLIVGVLGQYVPLVSNRSAFMDIGLVAVSSVLCVVASWQTLLPVRIAFVQLYKS